MRFFSRLIAGLLSLVLVTEPVLAVQQGNPAPLSDLTGKTVTFNGVQTTVDAALAARPTPNVTQRPPGATDDTAHGYTAGEVGSFTAVGGSGYTTATAAYSSGGCTNFGTVTPIISGGAIIGFTDDGTTVGCTANPAISVSGDGTGASGRGIVKPINNWLYNGVLYRPQRSTPGAAVWKADPGPYALPGDAAITPLAVYGVRRLMASYGMSSAFDVQFVSGGTTTTVPFKPDGLPDYSVLDAAAAVAGSTTARIVKLYDQTVAGGTSANNATCAFATAPAMTAGMTIGNNGARSLIWDSVQAGTTTSVYCTLPSGVTAQGNAVSAVALTMEPNSLNSHHILELSGSSPLYLGFNASATNPGAGTTGTGGFLLSYASTWVIKQFPSLTPFVSGFSSGSSAIRVWIDEINTNFSYAGAVTLAGGYLGSPTAAQGNMEFGGIALYARAITQPEQYTVTAAFYEAFNVVPQVRDVLAVVGDSKTQGYADTLVQGYARQGLDKLKLPMKVYNLGAFGQTTVQRLAAYPAIVAPLFNPLARNNVETIWLGTNDCDAGNTTGAAVATTATTAINALVSQAALARTTGFKVALGTMNSRGVALEPCRQALNPLIRAAVQAGQADLLFDLGADPTMGASGASSSNPRYFKDGIHETSLGHAFNAAVWAPAVNGLLQ